MMGITLEISAEDPLVHRAMAFAILPRIMLVIAPREMLRKVLRTLDAHSDLLLDDMVGYAIAGLAAVAQRNRSLPGQGRVARFNGYQEVTLSCRPRTVLPGLRLWPDRPIMFESFKIFERKRAVKGAEPRASTYAGYFDFPSSATSTKSYRLSLPRK